MRDIKIDGVVDYRAGKEVVDRTGVEGVVGFAPAMKFQMYMAFHYSNFRSIPKQVGRAKLGRAKVY